MAGKSLPSLCPSACHLPPQVAGLHGVLPMHVHDCGLSGVRCAVPGMRCLFHVWRHPGTDSKLGDVDCPPARPRVLLTGPAPPCFHRITPSQHKCARFLFTQVRMHSPACAARLRAGLFQHFPLHLTMHLFQQAAPFRPRPLATPPATASAAHWPPALQLQPPTRCASSRARDCRVRQAAAAGQRAAGGSGQQKRQGRGQGQCGQVAK